MKHRLTVMLAAAVLIAAWSLIFAQEAEDLDEQLMERAQKLHDRATVVDTHVDTPMLMSGRGLDIGARNDIGRVDLPRMIEGGLDAIFLAVFVSNELDDKNPSGKALETMDVIYRQAGKYPELAELAFSPDDIRRIEKSGRRAILIGMENGGPVEGSLALLRTFYRLGVRYITLTHNSSNHICDSSTDDPRWDGLSPFGIEMVREMNNLGMMIDVSHISDAAFFDVLEHSTAPVIASHSATRALCDVPRNLSDDMLSKLAENGGVIQIVFYSGFLDKDYAEESERVRKKLEPEFERLRKETGDDREAFYEKAFPLWEKHAPPAPPVTVLIDHIDHAVRIAGIDHVGIGSDFDGAGSFPVGIEDASDYQLITYHLVKRGYRDEDIVRILGENLLRVMKEVEEAGRK
ncbi:MAG: dipeptidase [Candidatus Krumholzibacteriota bacterium]